MLAQITVTFLQHHKTSTGEQDHYCQNRDCLLCLIVRLRCGLLEVDIPIDLVFLSPKFHCHSRAFTLGFLVSIYKTLHNFSLESN